MNQVRGQRKAPTLQSAAIFGAACFGFLILSAMGLRFAHADARSAGGNAPRLTIAVDGRRTQIVAAGVFLSADPPARARLVLQQRMRHRKARQWRVRAGTRLHYRGTSYHYRLRWRHPPAHRRLVLRVALVYGDEVLASSGLRVVRSGDPGTVFYSGEGDAGAPYAIGARLTLTASSRGYDGVWTASGHCNTSNAASFPSVVDGEPISALAGYSLGRLGPIYFLKQAPSRASEINYILMFDPGNSGDLSGCDADPKIGSWNVLAGWLGQRSTNKLVIMSGPLTSSEGHGAIRAYYLRNLSAATLQSQVLVCDTSVSHDDFMKVYGWMLGGEVPSSCPIGSTVYHVPKASSPGPTPGPTSPSSPAALPPGQFYVVHADGGVYWRSAPDWNTPVAITGNGFYPGTVVRISCYQAGAANVPETSNAMWERASWASGPGGGSGWINEHFVNDGAALNQPSPGAPPCASSPSQPPPPPPQTWMEQETPNHPVNTFTNYHNASGMGPPIAAGQWVEVSCRVYDPTIASVNPDGYWYRIASSPWSNSYYSPANTFMNGDPYGGPYTHNTDFSVPVC